MIIVSIYARFEWKNVTHECIKVSLYRGIHSKQGLFVGSILVNVLELFVIQKPHRNEGGHNPGCTTVSSSPALKD